MRFKGCTAIVSLLATMAAVVVPTAAWADEIQTNGSGLFSGTSFNLKLATSSFTVKCTTSILAFKKTSQSQAAFAGASFKGDFGEEQYCQTTTSGVYVDLQTNAGTSQWVFHADGGGVGRLEGLAGSIGFTMDVYLLDPETSAYQPIGECELETPSAPVAYTYGVNPEWGITETVLANSEAAPPCPEAATLTGDFEISGLTIH